MASFFLLYVENNISKFTFKAILLGLEVKGHSHPPHIDGCLVIIGKSMRNDPPT